MKALRGQDKTLRSVLRANPIIVQVFLLLVGLFVGMALMQYVVRPEKQLAAEAERNDFKARLSRLELEQQTNEGRIAELTRELAAVTAGASAAESSYQSERQASTALFRALVYFMQNDEERMRETLSGLTYDGMTLEQQAVYDWLDRQEFLPPENSGEESGPAE